MHSFQNFFLLSFTLYPLVIFTSKESNLSPSMILLLLVFANKPLRLCDIRMKKRKIAQSINWTKRTIHINTRKTCDTVEATYSILEALLHSLNASHSHIYIRYMSSLTIDWQKNYIHSILHVSIYTWVSAKERERENQRVGMFLKCVFLSFQRVIFKTNISNSSSSSNSIV